MPISSISNGESGSSVRAKLNDVITAVNDGTFTAVAITQGTLPNPATWLSLSATWNDAADTFRGVDITITNTASAAASTPFRIRGGAAGTTELFSVAANGYTTVPGGGFTDASLRFGNFNTGLSSVGGTRLDVVIGGLQAATFFADANGACFYYDRVRVNSIDFNVFGVARASIREGSGTPEGNTTANPGSLYLDYTNGKLYVKESGTGNTGWVVK